MAKLTTAQKAVFAAIAGMILVVLADALNIIDISNLVLLAAPPLAVLAYFVLPSLKDIKR